MKAETENEKEVDLIKEDKDMGRKILLLREQHKKENKEVRSENMQERRSNI